MQLQDSIIVLCRHHNQHDREVRSEIGARLRDILCQLNPSLGFPYQYHNSLTLRRRSCYQLAKVKHLEHLAQPVSVQSPRTLVDTRYNSSDTSKVNWILKPVLNRPSAKPQPRALQLHGYRRRSRSSVLPTLPTRSNLERRVWCALRIMIYVCDVLGTLRSPP